MEKQGQTVKAPPSKTDGSSRSQMIFIAVGLAIVFGGLWLLYDAEGPYHPDIPVTDTVVRDVEDS